MMIFKHSTGIKMLTKISQVLAIGLAACFFSACGGGGSGSGGTAGTAGTGSTGSTSASDQSLVSAEFAQDTVAAPSLNSDQRRRAESLMSIWENGEPVKAYGYAENIDDGRGVTWGWVGFTTADGDAIAVVEEFERRHPNNPLTPFLKQVRNKNVTDEAGFIRAVAASDQGEFKKDFEAAQNQQSDLKYYNPALEQAAQLGLKTAAGIAELYDSDINHGVDGVNAIIKETNLTVGSSPAEGADEIRWLSTYLDIRYRILAADNTWKTSTDRATIFKSAIVVVGNLNLNGPIHIESPQYGNFDIP
ncbi:chitosanase [Variovorax sp. 770b2]|uniref:chitosanase n=1 Tax=Variovorax sp. 770b2 TaxID=1566271 RepID=UPI000B843AB2|nr:chitosanase [Variovorax sp. 770b2]